MQHQPLHLATAQQFPELPGILTTDEKLRSGSDLVPDQAILLAFGKRHQGGQRRISRVGDECPGLTIIGTFEESPKMGAGKPEPSKPLSQTWERDLG
jgi:hypothetical protein